MVLLFRRAVAESVGSSIRSSSGVAATMNRRSFQTMGRTSPFPLGSLLPIHNVNPNSFHDNDDTDANSCSAQHMYSPDGCIGVAQLQHDRLGNPFFQQVRWKRKDGHSKFFKVKPLPKKKLKAKKRKKAALEFKLYGKHGAPGSKAGERRELIAHRKEQLLDRLEPDTEEDLQALDYNMGDALLDSLMGNTPHLARTETPQLEYTGDQHSRYYNRVALQMEQFREAVQKLKQAEEEGRGHEATDVLDPATLPSDRDISLVVRSFRDKMGTKAKPLGIAEALKHVLRDLSLPTTAFGELTYNALLTCSRTPKEARRIFKLMTDRQHPISVYSWSILVDVHAKIGDFEGCADVIQEMVQEGVEPSLPAYTSLLAACYKICNAGHLPKDVRDRAGKLAWEKWKEMRIVGIEPDVMAYCALLRIFAARGKAERALNIIEDMKMHGIKPTTLCYTSALRAVARSHRIGILYENGWSKRHRQREKMTSHHGEMARQVLIWAENDEVEKDDGFVSALMLCAAAAGDSATAKAIFLANEVQKLDWLRTIGTNDHLQRLAGIVPKDDKSQGQRYLYANGAMNGNGQGNGHALLVKDGIEGPHGELMTVEEREYGKDTRVLSAFMTACSQAIERNLGSMWEGKQSRGYLCANTLRRIQERPQPRYLNNSIPGMNPAEINAGAMNWDEDQGKVMSKRERRRMPNAGVTLDDSIPASLDDIDDYWYEAFKDQDPLEISRREVAEERREYREALIAAGRLTAEFEGDEVDDSDDEDAQHSSTTKSLNGETFNLTAGDGHYRSGAKFDSRSDGSDNDNSNDEDFSGTNADFDSLFDIDGDLAEEGDRIAADLNSLFYDSTTGSVKELDDDDEDRDGHIRVMSGNNTKSNSSKVQEEWYFDQDQMQWKSRMVRGSQIEGEVINNSSDGSKSDFNSTGKSKDQAKGASSQEEQEEEFYFDKDEMRWKTRPKPVQPALTGYEASRMKDSTDNVATLEESRLNPDEINIGSKVSNAETRREKEKRKRKILWMVPSNDTRTPQMPFVASYTTPRLLHVTSEDDVCRPLLHR